MPDNDITPGTAFQKAEDAAADTSQDHSGSVDLAPEKFDPKKWVRRTAMVTRSVPVCGRPDLMGRIEELKADLERAQSVDFDGDRPMARTLAKRIAVELEQARADMFAAIQVFRFRGLRSGELEEIKAAHGPDKNPDGVSDLDYKILAAQCVSPQGLDWEDFKVMHVGDGQDAEGLGSYFVRTVMATANAAVSGGGVDVPFSSAASALTQDSSKS